MMWGRSVGEGAATCEASASGKRVRRGWGTWLRDQIARMNEFIASTGGGNASAHAPIELTDDPIELTDDPHRIGG